MLPPARGEKTMTRFDRDTALSALGPNRFRVRIDPGWWITHGPNGGYVAAILTRAVQEAVADGSRRPRTLTVHYLSPLVEGDAEIEIQSERQGRTLTTVSARLVQDGRPCALALAALSSPRPPVDIGLETYPMPEVPSADELPSNDPIALPFRRRLDTRYVPGFESFTEHSEAVLLAWMRLNEPRPLDLPEMALYADGMPPAVFALRSGDRPLGVPTVELTVHFYLDPSEAGVADDDFVLLRVASRTVRDNFTTEDTDIWSPGGRLLCHARQVAALVEPRNDPAS